MTETKLDDKQIEKPVSLITATETKHTEDVKEESQILDSKQLADASLVSKTQKESLQLTLAEYSVSKDHSSESKNLPDTVMESGYAFAISKRRDSDMGRISKLEPSAPSDRSDITEEFKKDEMGKDDLRKSSFSAVEGSIYDDDSPLLTDFTTSSITYVSERIDSSSLELMAGDSFGDYLKASATVNVKSDGMKIEAQSPGSGISCVTTASETLDSSAHEIEKAQQTSGSIQHDIPTEYEKSISPSDNAASDFSTESATKYNLPYDTESDSHEVLSGLPKIRDERTKVEEIQDVKIIKPCKLMSMDPRHESASPQSDITEYTESVSYVESIIDSTNYENALKQKEKQLEQQKQDEKIDAQEKQLIVKSKEHHDEKIIKSTDEIVAEKKESTQVKKKPKTKATVTKISLQKQTPIEISKQSSKTVDIKSASKSVEYSSSTSRTTTVSRTYTSTRTHGYMQSTLSRDQKVLKPLNLADSTHSSPAKSSYRSASIGSQLAEKKTKSSRETSSGKPVRTATKLANQIDSAESSTVKKQQEHKSTVQGTKYSRTSTDRSDRTTRSSTSSFTSSTSRYRSRKSTEPFEKQEPTIKKADKEQANQATKTTVSTSKSTKERTNKSLIPVKVTSAKGSPRKEPPAKTTVDKSATKKISQPTEEKTTQIMIITTTKSVDTSVTDVQTTMSSKIGFVKTTPRVTKTTHKSGDLKQDDTYRCKSAMHYSYKDAVTFDHAEIPSSLPSSPSRLNKSSSNSTNVLTSEVFTRTIDSSKSIEVIYRQPSTSNELIRKINEYRYNDIDLTTDSSLSDSIALPSSSSEHENDVLGRRKRSGSPASPKAHTATSSAPPPTTATVSRKQGQVVSEQRYRKSDIWMRTGPPPEVLPDGDDGEIYQTLHADRRTVASLDGIVMENRISPILDFRASTPPRLKYKFDYDSSLFTDDKQQEPKHTSASFEGEEYLNLVHSEASNLVDSILEQSVSIVSSSQLQANAAIDTQAQSESEQYAIRSDILSSNEADLVVKSPTIESMSGKSFDDNISNPDYDSSEAIQQLAQFTVAPTSGDAGDGAAPTVTDTRESVGDGIVDDAAQKERRAKKIDRHFARLSSDIEPEALLDKNREYDEAIAQIKDEVSMLQSEFSKMSWDESISATTGDFGSSTPDHDLQETDTQLRTEITLPKPTPRSQTNLIAEADASATTTSVTSTTTTSSAAAAASSLTTSALGAKTTEDYAASILETDLDKPASGDMSELSSSQEPMPVPKPRTSISSRTDTQTRSSIIESFDQPEDSIEQYPEPSQQRQESLASEDFSGIAQKDGDFETSDEDQSAAKFYIGEKSTDIITRSTADKRADFAFDNIGYEYSQESGHEGEPLVDDAFKTYRDQTRKEDEFTLKSLQEVESGTALDAEIKAEVIEVIEGVASERTLELELDRTIGSVRQPVVHSPIKPQVVTVVEGAKPLTQKPRDSSETLLEDSSSFHYTKRTIDELVIEKTLDEVKESLDAVQEELIESVIDGKLLKQSPSEFEFKVLPSARYIQDPIYETQQEEVTTTTTIVPQTVTTTTILSEPTSLSETKTPSFEQKISDTEDKALLKPGEPSSLSSDSSPAKLEVSARLRATTSHAKGSRWSATDVDSSGESHYQSFEHTDSSRPLSSDVDNLLQQYASSEYETAMDHSILPASTEFHSAVSTLNSYNVSSHDSMKSFDSESSGNLASGESEATETLVPSTMDIDFDSEDAALLHDDSEEDLREKLIEHEELSAVSSAIPVAMKRSQEMNFATDLSSDLLADSSDVFQFQEEAERVAQAQAEQLSSSIGTALDLVESMKAASLEDVKAESTEEAKLGTSMEDGSILSISLSSASNLETIMENLPDKMDSLPTHVEVGLDAITPTTSDTKEIIGDITLTSTVVKEGDINFLNTQATTEIMSAESAEDTSKKRGHKRTESTIPGKLLSEIAAEARDSLDSQEDSISQEVATKQSSSERDDMREESSDSDYDRYESEYARSFRAPLNQGQKKKKDIKADGFEMEMEHDRRNSFSPSSAVIETIVEDVHAEIEQGNEAQKMMDTKREELQEYQQSSAQCIPDIQVTEDIQQIDFDQEEVPSQSQKVDTTASEQKIQFAKQEEFKISEEQYQEMIEQKYKSKMADVAAKFDYEADDKDDSAGSDSFEMLEQPDISDEFVIVEEVAREAHECDTEGKSVSIKPVKKEKKHDEEVEKLLVKSAPAHTNAGSLYANMREDMMYDFEESPPTGSEEVDPNGVTMDLLNNGYPLEESKRWVEMQLAETQNFRYPLEDRLEDIKEEDTDFEVGSSRIGSIKDSFSSTPDYDLLAKRLASREHDDISMSSLQEFENLEHVISLENRKMQQGSQDSLSNGSFTRRFMSRGHGDDISLSSLKEFEGLESACLEAQRIEIKAKEEAALLSRSDESNKSDKSTGAKRSPPTNGTIIKTSSSVSTVTSGPEKSTIVEVKATSSEISKDSLSTTTTVTTVTTISHDSSIRHTLDEEDTSHMLTVSTDSLDRSRVQKQTVTKDRLPSAHSSSDSLEINNKNNADVMTSSLDSIEFSKAGAITTRSSQSDSIEHIAQQQVQRSDSTDSIEMQHGISSRASEVKRDSLDSLPYSIENKSGFSSPTKPVGSHRVTTTDVLAVAGSSSSQYTAQTGMTKDISVDSLAGQEAFLTSTESLETSSTATNATYQNETDSQMSSSVTSCGSITMVDTLDNVGDFEGFGLQENITFKSTTTASSSSYSGQHQQQQQQQQHISHVYRGSSSTATTTTMASATGEFSISEIELLSRQMYPGELTFDDAKESAKEKSQSKTAEKDD